jgi:general secretion pathway protein K
VVAVRPAVGRQSGFALLAVLWSLGLLALLIVGLSASARGRTSLAANLRDNAIAEAAADGAVQQAIFQLFRGGWPPQELVQRFAIGRAAVDIVIEDQSDRFNPNFSSPAMLAALLGAVGADPAPATELSRALVDWRTAATIALGGGFKLDRYKLASLPYGPPNRPFKSVDEMGLVPGMTPDLLARLQPYLSVYQAGDARQTESMALSRDVLTNASMMGRHSGLIGYVSPDRVVLIQATAVLADGTHFDRHAVVRLPAQSTGPAQRPWQIFTWH